MSKIEWNKVTPLSKVIALVLFVALPFLGFYYGVQYGQVAAYVATQNQVASTNTVDNYYSDVAAWQTDIRNEANTGFSIEYPIDFNTDDNYSLTPSMDWQLNSNSVPGNLFFTLTIPRAFEPQSNFVEAKLTVGKSTAGNAISDCYDNFSGGPATTSTVVMNGVTYRVASFSGAGAGNFYETKSYHTVHGGACWVVEYTIHSSQIGNYPPEYKLMPFDRAKAVQVLDRMIGTFKFTQ